MDKKTEIALKYVTCRCDEAYKSRGLTAPDCPYHSTDPESAMDEWAELFAEFIREGEWHPRDMSDKPNWVQLGSKVGWLQPGHSIVHTTKQLYQSFEKSLTND